MTDFDNKNSCKRKLINKETYCNQANSQCLGENVNIIIVSRKRLKNRKNHNVFIQAQQYRVSSRLSRFSRSKKQVSITRPSSMPELNECTWPTLSRNRSGRRKDTIQNKYKLIPFQSNFIANVASEHRFDDKLYPFSYRRQIKMIIYRCEFGGTVDNNCCCTCNSDAMFEIMRSLYECYKKRDCTNCTCILCSHIKPEDKQKLSEREKVLREQAMKGFPLPEGKTSSEKKLINKVRTDLGVPIEPKTKEIRDKHEEASKAGKLLPLEGKTPAEKEKILQDLFNMGIPLPKGRTPSEKALISKISGKPPSEVVSLALAHSEQMRRAQADGLLTPLKGKSPEYQENILKRLAMIGLPLPEGQSPSENKLIEKVRTDLGLPIEPKTKDIRDKHEKASKAGKLLPLEGKTPEKKEKILEGLHNMGIPLPIGRTPSEKSLIAKIAASPRSPSQVASVTLSPSEQMRRAQEDGLLTPLKGKSPEYRENILRRLAMIGLPLPEGQSPSENKLIDKVRTDLGLPVEPKTKDIRDKHEKASKAGKLQPLEGKKPAKKKKILQDLHNMGIPLPIGRTPSEKSLIAKIAASPRSTCPCLSTKASSVALAPSEQMRRAKAEGLLTTLKGKTPKQREKILKGLAMKGLPLPEAQSQSVKKLIKKVRRNLGLPIEPKTKAIRKKHEEAAKAGKLLPLEGKKTEKKKKILEDLHNMGIPLPVGRTSSEKALIAEIKSKKPTQAVSVAPSEELLSGKTPEEKEKIIKGLAMKGIPLPEAQSSSEKKLIDKVRTELGLPKDPTTKSMKDRHDQAAKAGLLQPLEGKTPAEKEKVLKGLRNLGIPLPEGRTPSEKALIEKIKASPPSIIAPSEQLRRAKVEGLLTPLKGKSIEQKENIVKGLAMRGLPLPAAESPSEKKLIDKVRADLGLPKDPTTKSMKDRYDQAAKAGLLQPLEGKTPAEKEKVLKGLRNLGIPLPEGRTPSEKALIEKIKASPPSIIAPSEQLRRAKEEGLLTPLKGKSPEQKEKILKGLAMKGLALPEGQSPSEKKIIDKVRADLGLPKDPTTKSMKDKHDQAAKAGLLLPLEGKTPAEKEKVLKGLWDLGIPLPEGRSSSEKDLIEKVKSSPRSIIAPSELLRKAKAEGLLTPLKGKPPEQKEKILKGLAMKGLALPVGQSPSEKKLIDKVRADLGLPKDPTTKSMKDKHDQAAKAGLLLPLEGKTPAEKEKVLKGLRDLGIPLPEGRSSSEKDLIEKVKSSPRSIIAPSEQLRKAKSEGFLTPLKGKPPEQKEKILKGLAMKGLALPEGQSPSEKKLIDKVRADLGLPKDPTTKSMKDRHDQAAKAGLLLPLEGKTPADKEKVLKGLRDLGIPLPEGRSPSEKDLIEKVKASPRSIIAPSEQMRRAKAEGLLTPLKGKPPEQKEKILKGLAMKGLALPEGQSPSEKKLIDKIRADLGLPKEPSTKSLKVKHEQAAKAGLLQPLEGKTPVEKAKLLKGLRDLGIPLPEGRTPSEKALIGKVKESPRSVIAPSEQLRRAKAEGLLTPLKGKPPEQKEKILKGLAMKGLALPEGQSPSEKKLIDKVRADLGLPKVPSTKSLKVKHEQAAKAGLLQPLEGKTPAEKAKLLKGLRDLGIPLPEGRTPSEKALIGKVKAASRSVIALSEQLRRAKEEGLLTPLKGKPPEQKEKILKGLAMKGLALPEGQSPSEKKLIDKVRADLGLPKVPSTKSLKFKHEQAAKAGLLQPLEGKTPAEKEEVLKGLRDLGIPLPEGRTPSEKALVEKIKGLPRSVIAHSKQLRRAKLEGLLTPLKGKTPEDKEKILKGLAMKGLPLPEGQSPSENKLIDKVRTDLGLPIEPKTKDIRHKHDKASKFGKLLPLEGKTPEQKKKILTRLHNMGIPLPVGRTPSEKSLIAKIAASPQSTCPCWPTTASSVAPTPSEQMRKAKAEGLLTPLKGKTPEKKEKIVKGLAMKGLPLPEATSPSEKKLIDKVRADLGLPKDPTTKSMKEKHDQAAKAGLLQPLEGKTPVEKEKVLKGLRDLGIPLPEGRTPSEKDLIEKVKAASRSIIAPSEQMRRAKAEGLLTPLKGKPPEQKEKILKGLAMKGLALPEGQSPSEKKLIDKVRADLGLPKDPTTKSMKEKHYQAAKAGLLQPLEGKKPAEKEKVLKGLRDLGIPLPEGRTPSEKDLIEKVKAASRSIIAPSEQMRRAKAEGLLTPLKGKPPEQKEKILKGLAMKGLALPEGQSPSEKKLIDKVRADLGLPKDPTTKSMKEKHYQAAKAGLLQPLEGKKPAEKEKVLKGLRDLGIPLPEGRTPSEKDLIEKVKDSPRSIIAPSEQLRRAKAEGLLTPLKGKPPEQKEKILKGLAMKGLALPEGQSASEKKLIDKVRVDLGLPKDPTTKSMKVKHEQAAKAGLLQPLEGKTNTEKEKVLKGLRDFGIPLPDGRTPSEKDLIEKVKAASRSIIAPSEQMRRAKAEGLLTPLKGKPPEQKEKILKGLAMKGLALPEGQSASEKKLIDKVRVDLGLPKDPTTKSMKVKHEQAAKAGLLQPLEGKTNTEKEKVLKGLRDFGIPLPDGRTPSEKDLIEKVKAASRSIIAPSEQMRRAKAEGLLTPLKGKPPEQKEKILKGLAMKGLALPEGQSASEKKLIDKVRADLGLPKEPSTKSIKVKYEQAAKAGLLQPLEGKTPAEKEKVLKGLHDLGIPLPEGRTPSEKALIEKIKELPRSVIAPSKQLRRAKAAGLLTPLKGKTAEVREKILRGLAMRGLPLPEGQSPSENKIIDKVRTDLGLPIEPTTKEIRHKHEKASKFGKLLPLEGKTPEQKEKILSRLHNMGIPLPVGRTPSEKSLIARITKCPRSTCPCWSTKSSSVALAPSEQMRRAKAEGLLTPLKGKTPEQKEKIVKGLAMKGLLLPEATSPSEKKLIDKVRADLGLPKDPTTNSMKDKHEKAAKAGLLQPLEGKTTKQKEKTLKGLRDLGIPLPEGRTPSEKALIEKIKASPPSIITPSEQLRRAKVEGLLTPLKGKSPEQKENIIKGLAMRGLPLPEPESPSEKKLIDKVRADLGLPKDPTTKSMKDRHDQAAKAGLLQPLEGKTPAEKEKVLKGLRDLGIPLPEGRTPSEKDLIEKVKASPRSVISPSEQLRRAKAEGLLTPLKGKTPEQREKILKGLAMKGLALPEAQSPSEKKLMDKVRADLGLPNDPTTKSMKVKHEQAAKAGLLQPLEGKTNTEKAKLLKGLRDMGIPLPEGRTPSEKALIEKVKASSRSIIAPSEQLRRAKAEGLLTPLKGKPPEQKEKILKGLAMKGLALPEAQSPSEKKLIDKVRADLGLPKDPTTKSMKVKHEQAAKDGLLQPLEGKSNTEKEKLLKGLRDLGIPLPEGRTPSEKALISKVKASPRTIIAPSEQLRRAKAEGLLTPLKGKTPEQKEKILKGLAMKGLALPEAQSPSEKKLIDKVRADLGLPKDPKSKTMKEKHEQAAKAGLLQPLEGKTNTEKAKILKGLRDLGIPLPEGRTPSEKALINKVKASSRTVIAPSEQLRRAEAEGLLTPLEGKSPEQKEKILKGLAMKGLALPEAQSPSEKKLIDKVRFDLGLPKDPKSKSMKEKHEQAAKAGLLQPLEGKTPAEKEKVLKGLRDLGIPFPEGRTPSEKALINKVKASPRSLISPSEQLRRAQAEGLLTPLEGKTREQKEKILKGLAMKGLALPEAQSPSEKKLIDKVRADLGLPKDPKSKSMKKKHEQAAKAGLLQPLAGKTNTEKAKILKGLRDLGIPLPEGRTPSEKALINNIKASSRTVIAPSEQLRRAQAEGLLTPLEGKTIEEKEKILRGLAMKGLALPEAQSPSEKKLIDKVRNNLGLPKDPTTKSMKEKHEQAAKAGLLQPLEGKTPAEKAKVLKGLRDLGIPLPEGRTPSEKALIAKVKASSRSVIALSERLRKAKEEGLLTSLKDKTPQEREKILRGLAMKGLPLPEGKSPSENELTDKVRTDLGLPIEPETKDIRDKHDKAAKAGKLLPLEGKTPAQKKKILRDLHNMGIPLPIGRTPSEKSLIAKIAASPRGSSKAASATLTPSEQLRAAEAEGLLTPLKNKTPEEREKILKGLAMKGLPLPEGQSPSENKLIDKVRTDLGLPIEPKTKDIRDKHEKASKAGKLQPLEGKTPEKKEKILRDLHDMGIPLPIGRTASEKALIAKVMAGPATGVAEQYEEIEKTTKCDRACGCDRKKIRFKHSYVKIKVTSPDISSFCDCPDECFPRVKSGVIIDNEGIKVTVASALVIPSFTANYNNINLDEFSTKKNYIRTHTVHKGSKKLIGQKSKVPSFESSLGSCKVSYVLSNSSYFESSSTRPNSTESENIYLQSSTLPLPSKLEQTVKSNLNPTSKTISTASSLASILVLKSEMSLCSTISNKTMNTVSLTSVMNSSITSTSTHHSSYQSTDDPRSRSSLEELSTSDDLIDQPATIGERENLWNIGAAIPNREYTILSVNQTILDVRNSEVRTNVLNYEENPIVLMNDLQSKLDISKIINKIMSKKRFADASSIFIVVPMSEDEEEPVSSKCIDSMTSIYSCESDAILKDTSEVDPNLALRPHSYAKRGEQTCRKGISFYMKEISSSDTETMFQNESVQALRPIEMMKDEFRQINRPDEIAEMSEKAVHAIGTDTTTSIPCCCCPKEYPNPFVVQNCSPNQHYTSTANVISRQKKSLSLQDEATSIIIGFRFPGMLSPPPVSSAMQWDVSTVCPSFPGLISGRCHSPDMRTPKSSLQSLDLHKTCEVLTQTSSGFCPIARAKSGCSLPDMRTPSSLVQLRDSSSALKSRILPIKTRGRGRLPDMRTHSSRSLDLPCAAPTQSSMGSSHFPHKTTSYYRLPDMSSAESSILQSQVLSSSGVDRSSCSLSDEPCCCCCSPASTESAKLLSDIPTCSDGHVSLDNSLRVPARLGHDMHYSRIETTTPQRNCRELSSHTIKALNNSSNKLKPTFKSYPDEVTYPTAFENPTRTGSIQRHASQQSYMSIDSPDEEDCLCEDIECTDIIPHEILIQKLRIQESRKAKLPIDSTDVDDYMDYGTGITAASEPQIEVSRKSGMPTDFAEEVYWHLSCGCEDTKSTDNMSYPKLRLQASRNSNMPMGPTDGLHCLCEDIEGTNETSTQQPQSQRSRKMKKLKHYALKDDFKNKDEERLAINKTGIQLQPPQTNWESKMPIDSNYEKVCHCEDIEGTENIPSQEPKLQASGNSKKKKKKMPRNPANGEHCLCENIEAPNIITDEISNNWPRPQVNRKPKVSNYSIDEDECLCKQIQGTDKMPKQKPQIQVTRKFKMPINPSDGNHCPCEEKEGTNERSIQQTRFQASPKSKKLKDSTIKVDFKNIGVEPPGVTPDELGNQDRPPHVNWKSIKPKNSTVKDDYKIQQKSKDCECQQQSKDSVTKVNCECLRHSKDFAIEANCECQPHSPSAIKENSEYQQQPKVSTSNGVCACEETAARNRLCITSQGQQQDRVSTNSSKITKLITRIGKSISHKIHKTRKHNSKMKDEKKSVKSQSNHNIQTTPEQVLDSQQISPNVHREPEVVNDGYPHEYNCGWIDYMTLMRLRSELTETTSGFKVCKKRNKRTKESILEKPNAEIELDFEDAIKYYVGKNLDQFWDLISPIELLQKTSHGANKKAKKNGKGSSEGSDTNIDNFFGCCACPYGSVPLKISYESITLTSEDSAEQTKRYPKGFKFCLGGTGLRPTLDGPDAARKPDHTGAGA